MLETLRAYGGRAAGRGRRAGAAPTRRWPGTRCGWPGRPRPGCSPVTVSWPRPAGWMPRTPPCGRCWAGRWHTIRPWRCGWPTRWAGGGSLRGRLAGEYPLLCQAAGRAEAGSGGWCAAQLWLGWAAQFSADLAGALGHFTAVRDAVAGRPPSRALTAALAGRAAVLRLMGRTAEAAGDARRALALARQIGDPAGELLALADLSLDADYCRRSRRGGPAGPAGRADHGRDPRLGSPGLCSYVLTIVLADAGDLAEAARVGAAGLARARDAGDLQNQAAPAAQDRGPGPAGGPHRRRRGAPAGRAPPRGADRQLA